MHCNFLQNEFVNKIKFNSFKQLINQKIKNRLFNKLKDY